MNIKVESITFDVWVCARCTTITHPDRPAESCECDIGPLWHHGTLKRTNRVEIEEP